MHHRLTVALSVAILTVLALLGGVAAAQPKTELSFWHAMDGQLGEAVNELVKQFNQSQGEFEVKALYKGTYPEVLAAANAAYRQQAPPNIVQGYEVGTLSLMLSDAIVPVHRLIQQQKIPVNWADVLETATGYYAKDGRLSSMPFNVSTVILYYNKAIFQQTGLADTPPATWPEVEAASRKILAAGAASCGFSTTWPSWALLENTFAWHDQPFATNQNGYAGLDTKLLINSAFGQMHIGAVARWQQEQIFSYGRGGTAGSQVHQRRVRDVRAFVGSDRRLQAVPQIPLGDRPAPALGAALPESEHHPGGRHPLGDAEA